MPAANYCLCLGFSHPFWFRSVAVTKNLAGPSWHAGANSPSHGYFIGTEHNSPPHPSLPRNGP